MRAAWTDVRQKRIPNQLLQKALAGGALLGLGELAYTGGMAAGGIARTWLFAGILTLILLALSLAFQGALGMGDVKLMGISALYLGISEALCCAFYGFLAAAFASLVLLIGKRKSAKDRIPLAPFLLVGYGVWILS